MWVGRYFFVQVMSPHYSDQMSQRSQVSRIGLKDLLTSVTDLSGGGGGS